MLIHTKTKFNHSNSNTCRTECLLGNTFKDFF